MALGIIILSILTCLFWVWYRRWSKVYNRWEDKGVVHQKPYPFVGNMLNNLLRKRTIGEVLRDLAYEFKNEKYIGVYNFFTADLMLTDVDDIHKVLVKDFSYFMDRGPKFHSKRTMDKHLFLLTGAEWKGVRTKVSPAFSSGKLKGMFPLMLKSYDYSEEYLDKLLQNTTTVNSNDIIDMFIVSVSASSIFGIDPVKLANPDSEFKRTLDETSTITLRSFVALTLSVFFPKLATFLDLTPMGKKNEAYFINLVLDTFKERSESGKVRDDIIQQLLQLKQTGKIEVNQWINEDEEELGSEPSSISETVEITDEILISQGFIFLMAGFDALKSAVAMLLLELHSNKECLDKVVQEIKDCTKKHNGFTLQAFKEMEYLDRCLAETLRLHPPAEMVTRHCIKQYTFQDGPTVEPGTRILIPTLLIHRDPSHFPDPDKFKPDRFETPPSPAAYIPFGVGPRMCIARRFALQEMKLFVAKLLLNYDIQVNPKTELPVRTEKWFFLRRHASNIFLDFNKRNK